MAKDTQHRVLFPDLLSKPLHVAFDKPMTSSDGGAMLLGQAASGNPHRAAANGLRPPGPGVLPGPERAFPVRRVMG